MIRLSLAQWKSAILTLSLWSLTASIVVANPLGLVPTPKSLQVAGGEMPLSATGRIVATDAKLKPLAAILSDEILLITRLRLQPAEGEAKPGDIVLKINPQLRADADILTVQNREVKKVRDYAHTINVSDKAIVEGWDYRACCEGTATILQSLKENGGRWSLPKMQIKDWPHADYNSYMIDCARQGLPLMGLKACIDCMRYYKTRYLHLHASDDSAFYFPLKSYPQAGSHNGAINGGECFKSWDLEELKKVVAYADARGVTLVPELETPGHCTCLQEDLKVDGKYLLGNPGLRMFDLADDGIYPVLEKIINDMCDIFQSSPYFHIGGDEIQWDWFKGQPHVKEYLKKHGMREIDKGGTDDLAKQLVLRLNEVIKKRGKKTIYWGGYQGPPQDPAMTDCIVYSWYAGAREAQDRGFTTISVPWEIRGDRPRWTMYSSNGDMLKRTDRVLGSCRVAWEQSGESYVNHDCYSQDRAEGAWSPDAVCTAAEEAKGFPKPVPGYAEAMRERLKKADVNLTKILKTVAFDVKVNPIEPKWPVPFYSGDATITMTANPPAGYKIHYTVDGTEPTVNSPVYEKPIRIVGRMRPRAALFNDKGEVLGGYNFGPAYCWKDQEKNLATGKPVKVSGIAGQGKDAEVGENANDGWVGNGKIWGAWDPPQWWQVDLQGNYNLDRIRLFPYDHGRRVFQFNIEVSTDEKNWTRVVDETANTKPEMGQGHEYKFKPTQARYVRVNMLKNSIQNAVQLEEVRVYEVGK